MRAGSIVDGRGLAAALLMGAEGVQMAPVLTSPKNVKPIKI